MGRMPVEVDGFSTRRGGIGLVDQAPDASSGLAGIDQRRRAAAAMAVTMPV